MNKLFRKSICCLAALTMLVTTAPTSAFACTDNDGLSLQTEEKTTDLLLAEEESKTHAITVTVVNSQGEASGMYQMENAIVTELDDGTYLVRMHQKNMNLDYLALVPDADSVTYATNHQVDWYIGGGDDGYWFVIPVKSLTDTLYASFSSTSRISSGQAWSAVQTITFDTASMQDTTEIEVQTSEMNVSEALPPTEETEPTVSDCDLLVPAAATLSDEDKNQTVTSITSDMTTLSEGWYIVDSDVTTTDLVVSGAVNIILKDGCTLTANEASNNVAIKVSGSNSLTIWGQSGGTGNLNATADVLGAGIGGTSNESGDNITVNGGTVTAVGGNFGAGIGGGYGTSGTNIVINGGTVTAKGGSGGAGIGGGYGASGTNITINGGTVTAVGGDNGAGIGGGYCASGTQITINHGTVTANGGDGASGIGGGVGGSSSDIKISTIKRTKAGDTNPPASGVYNTGGDLAKSLSGERYVYVYPQEYITYTVTFDAKGGSEVYTQRVDNNDTASVPDDPTRSSYRFAGWYEDDDCTDSWDFENDTITHDTTLYAKWFAISFNWSSDYKTCEITYTSETDSSDTVTYDCVVTESVKSPATCSEKGTTTYTAAYGNDSESIDVEDVAIDPSNHTGETENRNAKEATCTEEGYTGDTYCLGCGAELSTGQNIEKKAHTLTQVAAKSATTASTGNKKYYKCSVCGKLFLDEAGTKETTLANVTIAKLKAANTMKLKSTSKTLKYASLKKKAAAVTITFSKKAQGKVTYILSKTAKKAGIKVSSKGKITVPKKCKKGTYKITVKAAGNSKYKAASKTFTVKVK